MEIKNSQVLITGGNRGIGLALAEEMSRRGAHLHLAIRSPIEFKDTESLLKLGARSVTVHQLDVGNVAGIAPFVENLCKVVVPDIIINNAGQLTGGLLEEQESKQIISMLQVNLVGLIVLTREFLPYFLKRKSGKIVNNASISGIMYLPCATTYAASKAGVVAFTESLKQELRGTGVSTLLMITPGVKTRMYDEIPKFYGRHLDLGFLSSIPAENWAKCVCAGVVADVDTIHPHGSSRFGEWMATHFPGLLEMVVQRKFKRE